MELMIIQYSLAVVLGIYLYTLPFRVVLLIVDIPKTLGLTYKRNFRRWKRKY